MCDNVDYILTAEAELPLISLLNYIDKPSQYDISKIPNLWYRVEKMYYYTYTKEYDYRCSHIVSFADKANYIPYMSMRVVSIWL